MVFSLFKKSDEKMPVRPAAKPRTPAPSTVPAAGTGPMSGPASGFSQPPLDEPSSLPPTAEADELADLDFTGIQIEEAGDPQDAAIEQAAIDFANGEDALAESVLQEALKGAAKSDKTERLWLMLFDLYRVVGKREAFNGLELNYARLFEKQPPVWAEVAAEAETAARGSAATAFKGDLVAANSVGLAQLAEALANPGSRLDLSKVKAIDADACEVLLNCVAKARKKKVGFEFVGLDALAVQLEPKIAAQDPGQGLWRMLLECYQQQGRQDDFDNLAVDFAVRFEISPPSWEAAYVPAKAANAAGAAKAGARPAAAVTAATAATVAAAGVSGDAFALRGEIRSGRLDGLEAYLAEHEQAVVDMAAVTRMDFSSAGMLLNLVMPHWQRGVSVVLRHPNHLVGELLNVVGVGAMATIVFARQ